MEFIWRPPWWSASEKDANFHKVFREQLEIELCPEHKLYKLPVEVVARGEGDDVLFKILDGSSRVAEVHLTWKKTEESVPWPLCSLYPNLEYWCTERMWPQYCQLLGVDEELSEFEQLLIDLGMKNIDIKKFEQWIYKHAELEQLLGPELYLNLISCKFIEVKESLDVLNSWYRKRFPECSYDLHMLFSRF